MPCGCRLSSRCSTRVYNSLSHDEYERNPCEEFLIYGKTESDGTKTVCELIKTALSLKHWAFAASVKFLQTRKFCAKYRVEYLKTLRRIVQLSPMGHNHGYSLRTSAWDDRETWTFSEIIEKGLDMHFFNINLDIFPPSDWGDFKPFCICNSRLKIFTTLKHEGKPINHFLYFSIFNRNYITSDSVERNGHYHFCPHINNQHIFF